MDTLQGGFILYFFSWFDFGQDRTRYPTLTHVTLLVHLLDQALVHLLDQAAFMRGIVICKSIRI